MVHHFIDFVNLNLWNAPMLSRSFIKDYKKQLGFPSSSINAFW